MKQETLKGNRVLIFQQRGWGIKIGHYLAKQLQDEGAELAALTFKKNADVFTKSQKEVKYTYIVNDDLVAEEPAEHNPKNYTLSDVCEGLGVDSAWLYVSTLRHYARSYKDKYQYSFKQNIDDDGLRQYIIAVYAYAAKLFDEFRPDIIIVPAFVDMRHIFFSILADKYNVPMIGVTDTKVKGYHTFTRSFKNDRGKFYDRVDALNGVNIDSNYRNKAKQYIQEFREDFKRPAYEERRFQKKSIVKQVRAELSPYRTILRQWIKGRPDFVAKNLGVVNDNRPARYILRDHYMNKWYKRIMNTMQYDDFENIGKFAYFPLQVQPEATIDVMAPFHNNQIETIRQVAQLLPGDLTLVVKEHPSAVGKRPSSFIEKIKRMPNVSLIDYRITSDAVLKRASIVISPSSTSLAESAFYNIPAIQLGDLGTTLKLPNVERHPDITTLSTKIIESLEKKTTGSEYERRLENYVAAAYDTGFDFNYLGTWTGGDKDNLEPLWVLFKEEIVSALK